MKTHEHTGEFKEALRVKQKAATARSVTTASKMLLRLGIVDHLLRTLALF
jgi:hypothetical protein